MKYLYGDGTESNITTNYLDYLRSVLEFSSSVLKGDTLISSREKQANELKVAAEEELRQLGELQSKMDAAVIEAGTGVSAPGAQACVEQLAASLGGEIARSSSTVQSSLKTALDQIGSAISSERAANEKYLEKLLLSHDLPESETNVSAETNGDGKFTARLDGTSAVGVDYLIDLAIPGDNLLATPLKIDRLDAELTIKVPKTGGLFGKGKMRPLKLGKDFVVAVRRTKYGTLLQTRNAITDGQSGLDITFEDGRIRITHIVKQKPGEPFAVDPEDLERLGALRDKVTKAVDDLKTARNALREVKLNDVPLCEHEAPGALVKTLVDQMAPIVNDISKHSLAPGELVLKRVLSGDRREEVFASVTDLLGILSGLTAEKLSVFEPLGLGLPEETVDLPELPDEIETDDTLVDGDLDEEDSILDEDDDILDLPDEDLEEEELVAMPANQASTPPPPPRRSVPPPIDASKMKPKRPSGLPIPKK